MKTTRRHLLLGCSTAVAAYAGARLGLYSGGPADPEDDTLVVIFLRGGMDGLSLFPPAGGEDRKYYEAARPNLKFPLPGSALLGSLGSLQLGLHPKAMRIKELFDSRHLAIVAATGLPTSAITRSHFAAMSFVELGTPGDKGHKNGWLSRHLASMGQVVLPAALALGQQTPSSLLGNRGALQLADLATFGLQPTGVPALESAAGQRLFAEQEQALRQIYGGGASYFHYQGGSDALSSLPYLRSLRESPSPANRFDYPASPLGRNLQLLSKALRSGEPRPRAATLDSGIWDTHQHQGDQGGGRFAALVEDLAGGLAAFWEDLEADGLNRQVTVVVQSEFGRELAENANQGTEHGYGNPMLVLSTHLKANLLGRWPGLHRDELRAGTDLEATTDYRLVIAEILAKRTGNRQLDKVFPGFVPDRFLGLFA